MGRPSVIGSERRASVREDSGAAAVNRGCNEALAGEHVYSTLKFCRDVWPGVGLRGLFFGVSHIGEGCVEYGDCLLFQRVGELKYCDTRVGLVISKCWQRGDREWRLFEEWKATLPCRHQAAVRSECVSFVSKGIYWCREI